MDKITYSACTAADCPLHCAVLLATTGDLTQAHRLLADLVAGGAALGWVDPPSPAEVAELLAAVHHAVRTGDAAIRYAYLDGASRGWLLVGLGFWRRYDRPTHRPHADLEKVAVARAAQRGGVGRALIADLIEAASGAGIEVLTLDVRADNEAAQRLYRGLGFREYGRLARFVAVREARYDKVFYALDLRPG